MKIIRLIVALFALTLPAVPAIAGDMEIHHAYAVSGANPKTGAAFFVVHNMTGVADRLLDVRSDAAPVVQLHVTEFNSDGVASMRHVEEGFELAADGTIVLERGGAHVMLMGLPEPLVDGQEFTLTLVFEMAGEIEVTVVVDNAPDSTAMPAMDHSAHSGDHSMDHSAGD